MDKKEFGQEIIKTEPKESGEMKVLKENKETTIKDTNTKESTKESRSETKNS